MCPRLGLTLLCALVIALLLLATPVIAFVLIASALTADAGLIGWVLTVFLPLALSISASIC